MKPLKIVLISQLLSDYEYWSSIVGIADAIEWHQRLDMTILQPAQNTRILILDQSVATDEELSIYSESIMFDQCVVTGQRIGVPLAVNLIRRGVFVFMKDLNDEPARVEFLCLVSAANERQEIVQEYWELQHNFSLLNDRESEVTRLVVEGRPNKSIARRLNVAIRTVEARRASIYKKLQVNSIQDLVRAYDRFFELHYHLVDCKHCGCYRSQLYSLVKLPLTDLKLAEFKPNQYCVGV